MAHEQMLSRRTVAGRNVPGKERVFLHRVDSPGAFFRRLNWLVGAEGFGITMLDYGIAVLTRITEDGFAKVFIIEDSAATVIARKEMWGVS